jgi:TonB family protein
MAPLSPNPVRAMAPAPDRRMSLLVTVLTYGVLFLGVQRYFSGKGDGTQVRRPPATQPVYVFDLSQLREVPRERTPAPDEEEGGGGGPALQVQETPHLQAMEARSPDAISDETPSVLPTEPMTAAPAAPGGAVGGSGHAGGSGKGSGTGSGSGRGSGSGSGAGEGTVAGADLDVDERIKPEYPPAAVKARIEGIVTVRMEVNDRGRPTKVWVVDGHPIFHESVISAFSRYRFRDLKKRGIPTPAIIEIPVWFHFEY